MKIVIYFVNDEKVMQKTGVLNSDHIDQQSTYRRPPVTNNQRIKYVHYLKSTDRRFLKIKFWTPYHIHIYKILKEIACPKEKGWVATKIKAKNPMKDLWSRLIAFEPGEILIVSSCCGTGPVLTLVWTKY